MTEVPVDVRTVDPELRSVESGSFSISDDRLVYNGRWQIAISKAGVFRVFLKLPDGYDIDHLGSKDISHWDEVTQTDQRLMAFRC